MNAKALANFCLEQVDSWYAAQLQQLMRICAEADDEEEAIDDFRRGLEKAKNWKAFFLAELDPERVQAPRTRDTTRPGAYPMP